MNRRTWFVASLLSAASAVPSVGGTALGQAQTAPGATAVQAAPDNVEMAHQQLNTLQKMLDEKLISPPEYEAARAKIMESIGVTTPPPAAPAPAPAPTPAPAPAP